MDEMNQNQSPYDRDFAEPYTSQDNTTFDPNYPESSEPSSYSYDAGYAAPADGKKPAGFGIAALIFGILSILLICIPIVPIITAIISIILGAVGMKKASEGTAGGKGMAIAGLIMGILCEIGGLVSTLLGGAILIPSMMGYTKKSMQSSINSTARTIYDSASTVLVEMDSEGITLPDYAVVCSDSNAEYGTTSFDADNFKERMQLYFSDLPNYEYYIVITDGYVEEAGCCEQGKDNIVGRYPDLITTDNDESFYDIYSDALY